MGKKRVRHSAEFKGKIALEALKGVKTVNELASSIRFIRRRSANGSGKCKGGLTNYLRTVGRWASKTPTPSKRNCTKKWVA